MSMVWETHKSEIDPLQKALPHIQRPGPSEDHATRTHRRRRADMVRAQLETVLHTASTEYVERVKNAVPTAGGSGGGSGGGGAVASSDLEGSEQQRRKLTDFQCRRELLHRCFLALGDLSRYRSTLHTTAGSEHANGAEGAVVAAAAE